MTAIVRRILGLLELHERRMLVVLLPMVIVMALLEVVGIASITPFLSLVGNPRLIEEQGGLARVYDALAFNDPQAFLVFLGAVSLAALVISNAFSAYMIWRLRSFANMRGFSISTRLLRAYLAQPYAFFLGRNSSELTRNLLTEVVSVVNGVIMPGLEFLAKAAATLFIVGLVLAVDPVLALVAFVTFGATYAIIYQVVKAQLARLGKQRLDANAQRFKSANEAIGAVKDLKVMGRERFYQERFRHAAEHFARANTRSQVIAQVPRYALETVAFGGVLVMVITLLGLGRGLEQILPIIGVYAFAVYRLMPSLQTLFSSVANIRYNLSALDVVSQDLFVEDEEADKATPPPLADAKPLPFAQAIELRNIRFRYPGADRASLEDVSLRIPVNTMVAFVGATGAGKTTIVDVFLGLLEPDAGSLLVDGQPVDATNVRRWQSNLGYVPQHIYLADDTVRANIALGVPEADVDDASVERAARAAQIHDFVVNDLARGYDTVVGERGVRLSGGQRQRIGIARALYHDPSVLVFDEATSALDSVTEKSVFEAIEALRGKKTVVVIAHRLSTVRKSHMIFVMDRGRVVANGSYEGLIDTSKDFRELAGSNGAGSSGNWQLKDV